jgi:hypothetical protein
VGRLAPFAPCLQIKAPCVGLWYISGAEIFSIVGCLNCSAAENFSMRGVQEVSDVVKHVVHGHSSSASAPNRGMHANQSVKGAENGLAHAAPGLIHRDIAGSLLSSRQTTTNNALVRPRLTDLSQLASAKPVVLKASVSPPRGRDSGTADVNSVCTLIINGTNCVPSVATRRIHRC